jgi:hypothetical protein
LLKHTGKTSLARKEMQVKTTLRFYLTPVRITTIKKTNNKCWRGCGGKKKLICCWWESKLVQTLCKTVWKHFKKLKMELPYDPAIPLLGIYLKECESGYNKGTCTHMFTAALVIIPKLWKQPRCPTIDEWIKKNVYLYTMEFYSATKRMKFCHLHING